MSTDERIAANAALLRLFKNEYRESSDRHSDALFVRDYFSPLEAEVIALREDKARIDWIEHMAEECEGRILTRLFLPDGQPFRQKVDAAMKLNPE